MPELLCVRSNISTNIDVCLAYPFAVPWWLPRNAQTTTFSHFLSAKVFKVIKTVILIAPGRLLTLICISFLPTVVRLTAQSGVVEVYFIFQLAVLLPSFTFIWLICSPTQTQLTFGFLVHLLVLAVFHYLHPSIHQMDSVWNWKMVFTNDLDCVSGWSTHHPGYLTRPQFRASISVPDSRGPERYDLSLVFMFFRFLYIRLD